MRKLIKDNGCEYTEMGEKIAQDLRRKFRAALKPYFGKCTRRDFYQIAEWEACRAVGDIICDHVIAQENKR